MRDVPVYPVIMCGGQGLRLWPRSTPARPKQFMPLVGDHSALQETVLRVRDLSRAGGQLVIVAGAAHGATIRRQLSEIDTPAVILCEPEARDSAAAIALAATWIARRDPASIAVIVASDHHIPDAAGFRAAIEATLAAAADGAIVTLGVRPASASTAYGYIDPGPAREGVRPVAAFIEKPDAPRAVAYMDKGYLWNSGNFVASAATLISEFAEHAPEALKAVEQGVAEAASADGLILVSDAFRAAPKISFDYAVMEKTRRAAVLPVDFSWSDLGAWDAVWAVSERDGNGNSLPPGATAVDASQLLVRAPAGVRVSVIGAHRLAVVVEPDAVLVCDMDHAQGVKAEAEALGPGAPGLRPLPSLRAAAAWFTSWMETAALPVWGTLGVDAAGGFREGLLPDGVPHDPDRRVRGQTRQILVFAQAAADGRQGPWGQVAARGREWLFKHAVRPDGLLVTRLSTDGEILDATPRLYEQAFGLLALQALAAADIGRPEAQAHAERMRLALAGFRHTGGGYREAEPHPYQANAHMHLLEACMAWGPQAGGGDWATLADGIVDLALTRFIDPGSGVLHEFFDAEWAPLRGEAGLVEPGHHFEWAWLLERWGVSRNDKDARAAARRLYELARRSVDVRRGVAVNSLWEDFSPRDASARLWPQTEHLKAALILGETEDALTAANALQRYLQTPVRGTWLDSMRPNGGLVDGPAPATSFYHIYLAVRMLEAVAGRPA